MKRFIAILALMVVLGSLVIAQTPTPPTVDEKANLDWWKKLPDTQWPTIDANGLTYCTSDKDCLQYIKWDKLSADALIPSTILYIPDDKVSTLKPEALTARVLMDMQDSTGNKFRQLSSNQLNTAIRSNTGVLALTVQDAIKNGKIKIEADKNLWIIKDQYDNPIHLDNTKMTGIAVDKDGNVQLIDAKNADITLASGAKATVNGDVGFQKDEGGKDVFACAQGKGCSATGDDITLKSGEKMVHLERTKDKPATASFDANGNIPQMQGILKSNLPPLTSGDCNTKCRKFTNLKAGDVIEFDGQLKHLEAGKGAQIEYKNGEETSILKVTGKKGVVDVEGDLDKLDAKNFYLSIKKGNYEYRAAGDFKKDADKFSIEGKKSTFLFLNVGNNEYVQVTNPNPLGTTDIYLDPAKAPQKPDDPNIKNNFVTIDKEKSNLKLTSVNDRNSQIEEGTIVKGTDGKESFKPSNILETKNRGPIATISRDETKSKIDISSFREIYENAKLVEYTNIDDKGEKSKYSIWGKDGKLNINEPWKYNNENPAGTFMVTVHNGEDKELLLASNGKLAFLKRNADGKYVVEKYKSDFGVVINNVEIKEEIKPVLIANGITDETMLRNVVKKNGKPVLDEDDINEILGTKTPLAPAVAAVAGAQVPKSDVIKNIEIARGESLTLGDIITSSATGNQFKVVKDSSGNLILTQTTGDKTVTGGDIELLEKKSCWQKNNEDCYGVGSRPRLCIGETCKAVEQTGPPNEESKGGGGKNKPTATPAEIAKAQQPGMIKPTNSYLDPDGSMTNSFAGIPDLRFKDGNIYTPQGDVVGTYNTNGKITGINNCEESTSCPLIEDISSQLDGKTVPITYLPPADTALPATQSTLPYSPPEKIKYRTATGDFYPIEGEQNKYYRFPTEVDKMYTYHDKGKVTGVIIRGEDGEWRGYGDYTQDWARIFVPCSSFNRECDYYIGSTWRVNGVKSEDTLKSIIWGMNGNPSTVLHAEACTEQECPPATELEEREEQSQGGKTDIMGTQG